MPWPVLEAWMSPFANLDLEGHRTTRLAREDLQDLLDLDRQWKAYVTAPRNKLNGGAVWADVVEELALRRAMRLFDPCGQRGFATNFQAATGAIAVTAALQALARPGETILALDLACGGHISHGASAHSTGRTFDVKWYGLADGESELDYAAIESLARHHRPRAIVAGASSFSRNIDWARLGAICRESGSALLADISHPAGLVAAGLFPNPAPHADVIVFTTYKTFLGPRASIILGLESDGLAERIDSAIFPGLQSSPVSSQIPAVAVALELAATEPFAEIQRAIAQNAQGLAAALEECGIPIAFGGTDSHIVMVDGRKLPACCADSGQRLAVYLESAGILANQVALPTDGAVRRSGLRLGVTCASQLGMGNHEMSRIAALLADLIGAFAMANGDQNDPRLSRTRSHCASQVAALTTEFPSLIRSVDDFIPR